VRLVYFINCFPNFIEAMIYREVMAVRAAGHEVETVSIRRPPAADVPAEARALADTTTYILPATVASLVGAHLRALRRWPLRYWRVLWEVLSGTHERWRDRWRTLCHFAEAVAVLPTIERMRPEHLHAHWAVGATTCAMVVSRFLGIPFSFTAHAYDIWRERLLLPEKLHAADRVVTCTGYNRTHLVGTYGVPADRVRVVYHGLDVDAFRRERRARRARPLILSVGRLVEQKGYEDLLRACAVLVQRGVSFECEILGDGPLRADLEEMTRRLGLGGVVRLPGRIVGERLRQHYDDADVFALLCVEASDGDRDGIPNTIVEAMAMELPVVSTRYSGVPELVDEGTSGLLAEPRDAVAAADALERLLADPGLRAAMGQAGRRRVLDRFTLRASVRELERVFGGDEPEDAEWRAAAGAR
jgi:glycosyltransferase involved in cell wall biosynthesis